jgi:hypothetical protein
MKQPGESALLILGLAHNVASNIEKDIKAFELATSGFASTHFFILESDSEDFTVSTLEQLKKEVENFHYFSLGNLKPGIPNRIDRISFCRNALMDKVKSIAKEIDYVLVADLDGVNRNISREAIESCWTRGDWGVCAANQSQHYYDIYALRHRKLSPNNCWHQYVILRKSGLHPMRARNIAVYSRQVHIPKDSPWIEVDSAFGGLAIYDASLYFNSSYSSRNSDGSQICEHVTLHEQIRNSGGRIFINPQMINSDGIQKKSLRYILSFAVKYIFSYFAPDKFEKRFGE